MIGEGRDSGSNVAIMVKTKRGSHAMINSIVMRATVKDSRICNEKFEINKWSEGIFDMKCSGFVSP